ncbi:MAG: ATP-dependent Clp protease proteolytic subunit, partial [Gammaproteobacteria bacterium]|nr:ATP-dependent Clp protease proteolytic subunit [Gammaproteobacteria bacterium]
LSTRSRLNKILAKHCGKDEKALSKDTDRDNFLSAEESVDYGLIDKVLSSRTES